MGLDVYALKDTIRLTEKEYLQEEDDNIFNVEINSEFTWHDEIISGRYKSIQEPFHFYAGSYSGYNQFRLFLFLSVNKIENDDIYIHPEKYRELPFYQLVYAQDDLAVYGAKTSALLSKNFIKYQDVATRLLSRYNPIAVVMYNDFAKAFHVAASSPNGMVIFG